MKLKIIINLLIAFTLGNLSAFSSEEVMPSPKRRKLNPETFYQNSLSLTNIETQVQLYQIQDETEKSKNRDYLREKIITHFEKRYNKGMSLVESAEASFIKKLSLDTWTPYLQSYHSTFVILCVTKALLDPDWIFPSAVKDLVEQQISERNASAIYQKGLMLQNGIGYSINIYEGQVLIEEAGRQGYIPALYHQSVSLLEKESIKGRSTLKGLNLLRKAAESKHADARNKIGVIIANNLYNSGRHSEASTEAFKWIRMAASQGQAMAIYFLPSMFEEGNGTKINYDQAIRWTLVVASRSFQRDFPDLPVTTSLFVRTNISNSQSSVTEDKYYEHLDDFKMGHEDLHALYDRDNRKKIFPTDFLSFFDTTVLNILKYLDFPGVLINSWNLKREIWNSNKGKNKYFQHYNIYGRTYISVGRMAVEYSNLIVSLIYEKNFKWNENIEEFSSFLPIDQSPKVLTWLSKKVPLQLLRLIRDGIFKRNQHFQEEYPGLA